MNVSAEGCTLVLIALVLIPVLCMTLLVSIVFHCRALLYLSHGVGEYMGRYEQLGQLLASHDVITFGHDHSK